MFSKLSRFHVPVQEREGFRRPRTIGLTENVLRHPDYDPNNLFDMLIDKLDLHSDAELCRYLYIDGGVISKMRYGGTPVSAAMLLRIHEVTGFPIAQLRDWMGVPSPIPKPEQEAA
jgi:hypothetical protein